MPIRHENSHKLSLKLGKVIEGELETIVIASILLCWIKGEEGCDLYLVKALKYDTLFIHEV